MKPLLTILCCCLIAAVDAAEQRIVSLTPALTELICHLGRGDRLVGRSEVCDYPETVRRLPVAGRFAEPNVERILALKPTLVVSNDFVNPGVAVTLNRAGIRTEMLQCRTIAEYRECVRAVGRLIDADPAAARELERIDRETAAAPAATGQKVLWVVWDAPLMIAGSRSLPDEVIRMAGAENVAGSVPQAYFKCSFDWLFEHQPDVIVWTASPEGWRKHRFWQKLNAVRNRRLLADLNQDLIQRPGPRIFDGVRELRRQLEKINEK